jgi:hypothetical protein
MTSETSVLEANPRRQNTFSAAPSTVVNPCAPQITIKDLLRQFKRDVYGKEVQTTSTYSYTWMADQVGHICLGIVIGFGLEAIAYLIGWEAPSVARFLAGSILVSAYELRTYLSSVREATGRFRLDDKCLRDNALIAAVYMIMGVAASFGFQQSGWWAVITLLALISFAILLAPPWLRQKIIWQKAGLPYLFRLADAKPSIGKEPAKELQTLIDKEAPSASGSLPHQVIVGGPIGSGRTPIAAGIGTEFAFKKTKVRYLSLDTLLECAARSSKSDFYDDTGPANIEYWRWSEAQVIIIDDVGPLISAQEADQRADLEKFRKLLHHDLAAVKSVLGRRHTVWVIGDLRPDGETARVGETLNEFACAIADFCNAKQKPLVVELSEVPEPPLGTRAKPGLDRAARHAQLRWVCPAP